MNAASAPAGVPASPVEPRWPAILALLSVFFLIIRLPDRYHVLPDWFPWVAFAVGIGSMVTVALLPANNGVRRSERTSVIVLFFLTTASNLVTLRRLVIDMVSAKHGIGSLELLETAAALWTVNVVIFALLYWQTDHARRHLRSGGVVIHGQDFQFAEETEGEHAGTWSPFFVDYLFLAFASSTSFTPPDYSRPKSHFAKVLVMLQASISLVTLVLIAARAVGTLA